MVNEALIDIAVVPACAVSKSMRLDIMRNAGESVQLQY